MWAALGRVPRPVSNGRRSWSWCPVPGRALPLEACRIASFIQNQSQQCAISCSNGGGSDSGASAHHVVAINSGKSVRPRGAFESLGNVGPKVRPFCGRDFSEKSMSRDCACQAFFAKIGSAKRTQNRGRFSDQKCVAVGMNLGACPVIDFAEFDMRSLAAPRAAPRFIGPSPKRIEAELVAASAGALICFRPRHHLYSSFSSGFALVNACTLWPF